MRGTRYGDFSRLPESWQKGYRAVLMQQGRVQLDADWNTQVLLAEEALREAIADVTGGSFAPAAAPGYEIRPSLDLVFEGRGALIVEGASPLVPGDGQAHTL